MDKELRKLYNAAKIFQLDERIRTFLTENDPMALKQLEEAINTIESKYNIKRVDFILDTICS